MEITMNDVIAFVRKAMENKLEVRNSCDEIYIYSKRRDKHIGIYLSVEGSKTIIVDTNTGLFTIKNLTDREELSYHILCLDVKSYMEQMGVEDFNNFFKEDDTKVKDINDLDSEDE